MVLVLEEDGMKGRFFVEGRWVKDEGEVGKGGWIKKGCMFGRRCGDKREGWVEEEGGLKRVGDEDGVRWFV